jgi:hypothetical protein
MTVQIPIEHLYSGEHLPGLGAVGADGPEAAAFLTSDALVSGCFRIAES